MGAFLGLGMLARKMMQNAAQPQPQMNYSAGIGGSGGGQPSAQPGAQQGSMNVQPPQQPPLPMRMLKGAKGNLDRQGTSGFGEQAKNALYGALGAV